MAPPGAGSTKRSTRKDAWKAGSLRSTFGHQVLGRLQTAPACGFGSSGRDQAQKCYVSQEVDKAQVAGSGGNQSQGAIYRVPEALGKQVLSTRPSSAQARFGTSKRSSMALKTDAPGPGAYKVKSPLGNTTTQTGPAAPRTRFGNANRDAADKVYLSHEHEKGFVGKDSPGPLAYNVSGNVGKQTLSKRENSPTWKLGTGKRFADNEIGSAASVPGPGQYSLPRALGPQITSTKKSLPAVGFGRAPMVRPQTAPLRSKQALAPALSAQASKRVMTPEEHLSSSKAAPKWGFGSGSRLPTYVTDTPGPGEYYA